MPFAKVNDIVLHYRVQGREDGQAVALVNSLGTDARIWDAVAARLAGRYRLVSFDKRGHGLSDAPAGDYTIDDHAADLIGLLDHLGIGRVAVCGVSVGGVIGQRFALRHAGRLAALVLCATAPRIGDAALWTARIEAVRRDGLAAMADGVMERWFSPGYRAAHPDDLAGWRNMLARTPAEGYAGTCAALRDADLTAEVGAIAAPTLVVAGEADLATPVELVREAAGRIPDARFEILAGVGHLPCIERPAALAGLMQDFFDEVGYV